MSQDPVKPPVRELAKSAMQKVVDGALNNLGAIILVFVLSGGYLAALNFIQRFQDWVNSVPSQWFLTPLVLLVIVVGVLARTSYKQRRELADIRRTEPGHKKMSRMVTHCGVWWKIFPANEYIEDFPYCPCCDPPRKLVQIQWFEEEEFKCPHTGTQVKLYDGVPRERSTILDGLYRSYFRNQGSGLYQTIMKELQRRRELSPDTGEDVIFSEMLEELPLSKIPEAERSRILATHATPGRFLHFVERHYHKYAEYLEAPDDAV